MTTGSSAAIDHSAVCPSLYNCVLVSRLRTLASICRITVLAFSTSTFLSSYSKLPVGLLFCRSVCLTVNVHPVIASSLTLPSSVEGGTKPREQLICCWDVGDTMLYSSLTGNLLSAIHLLSDRNAGSDTLASVNHYYDSVVRSIVKLPRLQYAERDAVISSIGWMKCSRA